MVMVFARAGQAGLPVLHQRFAEKQNAAGLPTGGVCLNQEEEVGGFVRSLSQTGDGDQKFRRFHARTGNDPPRIDGVTFL
ncbi:MAG: hypothetical protein QOJ98_2223 [Acidobacteriota bacterium]|nr:hypothetical protein [Acidobacteriota bacterium]